MKYALAVLCVWLTSLTLLPVQQLRADEFSPQQLELFEKQIRPLLVEHCVKCHGPGKQEGGLNLVTRESTLQGGDSGPALVPGKPGESLLITAVEYLGEPQMPPTGKLTAKQIEVLRNWVESGAAWPAGSPLREGVAATRGFQITDQQKHWWAFQPRITAHAPGVRTAEWPLNEVDRFVLAKLEAAGLEPAPAADPAAWLRRTTFDLTGLPPTPDDIRSFTAEWSDAPERACSSVVDRLLDSPAYGQRWARHWLDVVRYADFYDANPATRTASCELTEAWRYRDWVVDAFNRDLPFDQFIVHQITGDLLPSPAGDEIYPDGLVATTFLSNGVWDRGDADKEKIVSDMVDDNIGVIGKAFLGLTLECARCHDHKFDPISTEDYYALAGMFYSSHILKELGAKGGEYNVNRVPLIGPTALAQRTQQEQRLAEVTKTLTELERQQRLQQLTAGGQTLKPVSFHSEAGATGKITDDGSVVVSGPLAKDTYIVEAIVPEGIKSRYIRLHTLPDEVLPARGPGRARDGNFVVSRISASFIPPGSDAEASAIRFVA
ncbi:MAG TPA: hypothetical protein DIT89_06950, partial [Planctomycetaceae bacterium]|nr:hypothetical protein [Planctomycetaceae bacterium]